mmetsp:Transcript_28294/g.65630  ORF Transcript_28294/g.65630 Transcript_28294/m.65630 type:complete len:424 (-) Transcript_28294:97-1368(-)
MVEVVEPSSKRARRSKWGPDEGGDAASAAPAVSAFSSGPLPGAGGPPNVTQLMSSRLGPGNNDAARIYVGNLGPYLGEAEVRQIFSAVGLVVAVDMPKEGMPPRSKGFCFVEMCDIPTAKKAVEAMHEMVVAGRRLKVTFPSRPRGVISGIPPPATPLSPAVLAALGTPASQAASPAVGSSKGADGSAALAAASAAVGNTASLKERRTLAVTGLPREFKEKEVRSLFQNFGMIASLEIIPCIANPEIHCGAGIVEFLNEKSAREAMSVMLGFDLGNGATLTVQPLGPGGKESLISAWAADAAPSLAPQPVAAAPPPVTYQLPPSDILALENLVAPGDVDEDLADEVKDECRKFGKIRAVKVYESKDPPRVRVFVNFDADEAVDRAVAEMNGRWFGGRRVQAYPYNAGEFEDGNLDWNPPMGSA